MTFCEQCWRFVVSRCIKQKYSGNRKTNKSYRSCQYKEIHGNNTTENCNFTNKNANRQHSDHAPNKWWICHPFIVELMAFLFVCMCVLHYVAALQFMSFILWNSALCASPYRDLACDSNCLSSTRMNLTGWQKKLIDAFMNAPGHQRNSLKSLCICWPDSYCGFNYCLIFLFSPSAIENL